jgi:integrase
MQEVPLLDCAGRRRSPATLASFHQGRAPRNKGLRYPADPPTVEEIIAVMRVAGDDPDGLRLRGLIVVLWRAGLRISEALALAETDLDHDRGAILRGGISRGQVAEGRRSSPVGSVRRVASTAAWFSPVFAVAWSSPWWSASSDGVRLCAGASR